MATKIQYLTYYVHLTDAAQVAALQTSYPNGRNLAVVGNSSGQDAVTIYNAPYRGYIQPAAAAAPYTWTPWKRGALPGVFPLNVRTFERTTGGFWGFFGTTTRYYWMAKFVLAGTPIPLDTDGNPVEQVALARRRFLAGYDSFNAEDGVGGGSPEGGNIGGTYGIVRAGRRRGNSRWVGGAGTTTDRSITSSANRNLTDDFNGGVSTFTSSWERFYLRPRRTDSVAMRIWRCQSTAGNTMLTLDLTSGGILLVLNGNALTLLGAVTSPLIFDRWNKIDVLLQCNTGSGSGRVRVYVKGVLGADFTVLNAAGGIGTLGETHRSSSIMGIATGGEWIVDWDDWVNADLPSQDSNGDFTGADWLFGSSVRRIFPRAFAGTHSVNWTGDVRLLKQGVGLETNVTVGLTSSTASAKAAVTTDFEESVNQVAESVGIAAIEVGALSVRGAASGRIGYNVNGAGDVFLAVTEGASPAWATHIYRPTGLMEPQILTSLELLFEKGASADAATLYSLLAHAEHIGIFGDEDLPDGVPSQSQGVGTGEHNAPYPRSPWAMPALSGPISPYCIMGGTYVGNGTAQTITFKAPVHWFKVRPLTASQGGANWWSSMIAAHQNTETTPRNPLVEFREDQTFVPGLSENEQQQRYQVEIVGNDADWNQLGITYQWIAVSDPGMRFMCNGSYHHIGNSTTVQTNPLPNADFTPEWLWLQNEEIGSGGASNAYVKGPDMAAASLLNVGGGALTANALTFGLGSVVTQQAGHFSGLANTALSAWRRADGNADPGQNNVVTFGSYVGDNVNPRTIVVTPTSTKRPMFVAVVGEAGGGPMHFRDPSHTGTTSSLWSGGDVPANGIRAGAVSSFDVGSSLNANTVRHHYFVLWGDSVAGNGGFSGNPPVGGEFVPVEANSPADGPWPDDPEEPTDPVVAALASEPDLENTTVLSDTSTVVGGLLGGDVCEVYTRALVNIALGHIGISKEIANLNTEQSEAAAVARRHLKEDINRTLRDFPWDFATAYENLVLVTGSEATPANNDWLFAYEVPNRSVFCRRIAKAEKGRKFDPDPVPFREGFVEVDDGLGTITKTPVIFCNIEATDDVPLVLEFTKRQDCPAFYGDALFREALTWKFAASFAQSLSRDRDKQKFALEMYAGTLHRASAVDAKEQQQEKPGDADWISARN